MKRVSKNFISLFVSDTLSRLLGFIATVYVARILAVEGFGLIHFGLAFLTYAMLFTNPGLTTIGAREIARECDQTRIVFEILGLRITLSALVLVLCGAGLLFIPGDPATKRVILVYFVTLIPFSLLLEFVFQGREEMEYIGISRVMQSAAYAVFLIVLVRGRDTIALVPVSYVIAYGIAALFLLFAFINRYRRFRIRFSVRFWRELLVVATPVGLATIFNQAALTLPPLILGIFFVKETVGVYSAAYKIIIMLLIVERVFHYVSFPVLAKQFTSAPTKLANTFSLLSRILLAITIPCAIGGIVVADRMITLIYGAGYEGAVLVLRILLLYFAVTPVNSIYGYGLVAVNKQRRFLVVIAITALVNAVLILVLAIRFSAPGAAAALAASEFIGLLLMNRELQKMVSFAGLQYCMKPLITGLIMGSCMVVLLRFSLWIILAAGVIVYVITAIFLKIFTVRELQTLRKTLVS